MKKLTSMLLSLVIVWQVFAVPTFADNNETTEYWSTMESFGVVDPEQNRNSTFTVADMSKMIYNLLNNIFISIYSISKSNSIYA